MILSRIASILLYFFIFLSAFIFSYLYTRSKKTIFAFFAIFIPSTLVAFRSHVGTDTESYIQMFNEVSTMSLPDMILKVTSFGIEPFAIITIKFANLLGFNHLFFFFSFSLITFLSIFFASKLLDKKRLWLLFSACTILILPFSINTMRQSAAITIVFLATSIILNNRSKKLALSLFALACTIHYSSLLVLPAIIVKPLLERFGFKKCVTFLSIILLFFTFVLPRALSFAINNDLLPQKYADTFGSFTSNLLNFDFLLFSIILFALFLTRNRNNSYHALFNQSFILLVFMGICYSVLGFFSAYLGRFSDYFWPFVLTSIWLLIDRLEDTARFKYALFISISLAYFTITTIVLGNSQLLPYGLLI